MALGPGAVDADAPWREGEGDRDRAIGSGHSQLARLGYRLYDGQGWLRLEAQPLPSADDEAGRQWVREFAAGEDKGVLWQHMQPRVVRLGADDPDTPRRRGMRPAHARADPAATVAPRAGPLVRLSRVGELHIDQMACGPSERCAQPARDLMHTSRGLLGLLVPERLIAARMAGRGIKNHAAKASASFSSSGSRLPRLPSSGSSGSSILLPWPKQWCPSS